MLRSWLVRAIGMAAAAAFLAACAAPGAPAGAAPPGGGVLQLSFEDVLAPAAFTRDGPAEADAADGAAGFWAVVPGLPRPERARVENLATGATTTVALYVGRANPRGAIRLSGAAAEALGVGAAPVRVRVTALRREPRIAPP